MLLREKEKKKKKVLSPILRQKEVSKKVRQKLSIFEKKRKTEHFCGVEKKGWNWPEVRTG